MDNLHNTHTEIFDEYTKGMAYKTAVGLYDTVKQNENFFIGKQWEGVVSNGLPTPVFNFIKRVVLFLVSSAMSESVALNASALPGGSIKHPERLAQALNHEFKRMFEQCDLIGKLRVFLRNAAVDGDACLYMRYDPELYGMGGIIMEIVENTRVFFGNPNERGVENQPYILLATDEYLEDIKKKARENGASDAQLSDLDALNAQTDPLGKKRAAVLLKFWRDEESGHIFACETCEKMVLRERWDTGLSRYPITWLSWDFTQDSYHGQAAVSGLIPNQVFVNKLFAMAMISLMSTAYPKIVYDSTRIGAWDNRVGTAVPVAGGDVSGVASIVSGAQISPQVHEFIDSAIAYTRDFMGATDAALGITRPDNTSAILALQRASQVPLELIRQEMFRCVEDLGRIAADMFAAYYGKRETDGGLFDFGELKNMPFSIKLDAGASGYWSEIASLQSLDNLLAQGLISAADYLERVPAGLIADKETLIETLRARAV